MTNFSTVILAAGKGTRMKSALPKPLHMIAHKTMLGYVVDACKEAGAQEIVVVIAPDDQKTPALFPDLKFAVQHEQRGTGQAAKIGIDALTKKVDKILVAIGDEPFVSAETISKTVEKDEAITLVAMRLDDPLKYGRLVTDNTGALLRIVEHKDATEEERKINLCSAFPICFDAKHANDLINKLQPNNIANEYYLTETFLLANEAGLRCGYLETTAEEGSAANSREELAYLENVMQQKLRKSIMAGGTTLQDPNTVYFAHDTKIGKDVVIEPNVFFGPGVTIGDNVQIRAFSHIEGATIENDCEIGPFARIGLETKLGPRARIGNFVETKKAVFGERATAKHLSYVGTAELGKHVNIGAGTIFCNWDGFEKFKAVLHDNVLIGSNNSLVAPLVIGENAITAAGSVITKDVAPGDLALARSTQTDKPGWATAFRLKKKALKEKK